MESQNGYPNGKPHSSPVQPVKRTLRVLDWKEVQVHTIMLLANEYGGEFTHFRRSTQLCRGADCPAALHNIGEPTWKGYTPILAKDYGVKRWIPFVLEMTENLERDMRYIFARGQLWEIWRDKDKGKTGQVCGKLIEDAGDVSRLPEPFDVIPVVRAMYHSSLITLKHKNPMPDRVIVEEIPFDEPSSPVRSDGPVVDSDRPSFVDDYKKIIAGRKSPSKGSR